MIPYEIIYRKQQGEELSRKDLYQFIMGYVDGSIPDYQMSAFLMAVYFRGMTNKETLTLVEAMLDSGQRIDLSHISDFKVDKHSTGGVGDKVTIPLTPLIMSAGVKVPMISGRGLGHTGGTLDKLESIPGFRVKISMDEFIKKVERVGACIMEQNDQIVPADKKMYALRDVTSTVRSIPLMCGSIMSKKIAEGIDGLVLDVKTGSGAFIQNIDETRLLARSLKMIGENFGLKVHALITDMNQPLGTKIGNWLEIEESIDCLLGRAPSDLQTLTLEIGAHMILLAGIESDLNKARKLLHTRIENGKAFEEFLKLVRSQGGDTTYIENPQKYKKAKYSKPFLSEGTGYISKIDTSAIGMASVALGAGRSKIGDAIDFTAGIIMHTRIGDAIDFKQPLCTLYANSQSRIDEALLLLKKAFSIDDQQVQSPPLIHEKLI